MSGEAEVQRAIRDGRLRRKAAIEQHLDSYGELAVDRLRDLAVSAESERIQLQAAMELLDRIGIVRPVEEHHGGGVNVQVNTVEYQEFATRARTVIEGRLK